MTIVVHKIWVRGINPVPFKIFKTFRTVRLYDYDRDFHVVDDDRSILHIYVYVFIFMYTFATDIFLYRKLMHERYFAQSFVSNSQLNFG